MRAITKDFLRLIKTRQKTKSNKNKNKNNEEKIGDTLRPLIRFPRLSFQLNGHRHVATNIAKEKQDPHEEASNEISVKTLGQIDKGSFLFFQEKQPVIFPA